MKKMFHVCFPADESVKLEICSRLGREIMVMLVAVKGD